MGKIRTFLSLVFSPIIKVYRPFRRWWRKRRKAAKFLTIIAGLLFFYATAQWIILVLQVILALVFLNLGVLWFQALVMMTQSVIATGGGGISRSKAKLGRKKRKPPGKKPRGGKQGKRKKNKSRS